MTKLERMWQRFERATVPPEASPMAHFAMSHAYHSGAYDMLLALTNTNARRPGEAAEYLRELEDYCLSVMAQDVPIGRTK